MDSSPQAQLCPKCGSPLQLDVSGQCIFCQGAIRTTPLADVAQYDFILNGVLVPGGADIRLPEPAGLILVTLDLLSRGAGVRRLIDQEQLLEPGLILTEALIEAARRARDAKLAKGKTEVWIDDFTDVEIWDMNLGIDLIAMLGTHDAVGSDDRASNMETVILLDRDFNTHHCKKAIKKTGDGPVELRPLRARVPHRH